MANPDDTLVVIFKNHANPNEAKSREAGRLICDDMDVCEIRAPGARNTVSVHPATERSHWATDPLSGAEVEVTYAERFSKQFQQYKLKEQKELFRLLVDRAEVSEHRIVLELHSEALSTRTEGSNLATFGSSTGTPAAMGGTGGRGGSGAPGGA